MVRLQRSTAIGAMVLAIGCGAMGKGAVMAAETTHRARPTIPPREALAGLPPDGGPHWNRLVFQQSPYLLQHAANPVDWYPWGEEAFRAAREQDKPVFLSVGYSTCHWCHVMEHESFEDEEVAALLNRDFIAVKVDREERPDIDHVYMTVTQALTGSGGWPMTVFLTPDKRPFYAGTYFPKHGAYGRAGMMELLPAVARHWRENRESVFQSADEITQAVAQLGGGAPGEALDAGVLALGRQQLAARYDDGHGGFGSAPKFPTPHALNFLLRWWRRSGDDEALAMVEKTLDEMRRGGIYDHVGFGFHRYSTDARWLVPHFEKMLYDQALHVMAYTEAYQATGKQAFAETAREVLTYVLRDMTAPEGGFYSAEDADSEGEEGKFYVWTTAEVRRVLGDEEGRLYIDAFRLADEGNFLEESTRRLTGANIPHRVQSLAQIAKGRKLEEAELRRRLEAARERLFDVRRQRIHPQKDDKILTDWNGLMIAALALASRALGEPAYATAAARAADFVLSQLRDADGRLAKRYRNGEAGLPAHLDDYAFLAWGLLELHETTFEPRYLREAIATTDRMLERFWDEAGGALFMTPDDGEPLLVRSKEVYDGAIPSGNSVAASNLLRLAHLTGNRAYARRAEAILSAFSDTVTRAPSGFCQLLIAVDFAVGPSLEIVIAGRPDAPDTRAMLAAVREPFAPNKVVLFRPDGEEEPEIVRLAPYTASQRSRDGAATAYVCRNFACDAPITDPEAVRAALRGATAER